MSDQRFFMCPGHIGIEITTTGGGDIVRHWQVRINGEFAFDTSVREHLINMFPSPALEEWLEAQK